MELRLSVFFASLTTTLLAQGTVPPFRIGPITTLPGLSAVGSVIDAQFIHQPGDPPSVFYCAVSLTSDLLCGSYDVLTDTFTPNNDAAALNTSAVEFGLRFHHSGLLAIFDRNQWAWLASRSAIGQPWQIVGQVAWPTPPVGLHASLADYRGQPHVLYAYGHLSPFPIWMQPIDLITAQVFGQPIEIVRVSTPYSTANCLLPTPVTDPNGELIGVSYLELVWSSPAHTDHYLSLDLDPGTPAVLINSGTTTQTCGDFVGGRFFRLSGQVAAIDTVWFTGGRAPVGGTMHVRMFSPPTAGPEVYLSLFAVGSAFLPAGLPIPPMQGMLGINPSGWISPWVLQNNANGEAQFSFAIPSTPSLSGTSVSAQSLTLETVSGAVYLGNTARLAVD